MPPHLAAEIREWLRTVSTVEAQRCARELLAVDPGAVRAFAHMVLAVD